MSTNVVNIVHSALRYKEFYNGPSTTNLYNVVQTSTQFLVVFIVLGFLHFLQDISLSVDSSIPHPTLSVQSNVGFSPPCSVERSTAMPSKICIYIAI